MDTQEPRNPKVFLVKQPSEETAAPAQSSAVKEPVDLTDLRWLRGDGLDRLDILRAEQQKSLREQRSLIETAARLVREMDERERRAQEEQRLRQQEDHRRRVYIQQQQQQQAAPSIWPGVLRVSIVAAGASLITHGILSVRKSMQERRVDRRQSGQVHSHHYGAVHNHHHQTVVMQNPQPQPQPWIPSLIQQPRYYRPRARARVSDARLYRAVESILKPMLEGMPRRSRSLELGSAAEKRIVEKAIRGANQQSMSPRKVREIAKQEASSAARKTPKGLSRGIVDELVNKTARRVTAQTVTPNQARTIARREAQDASRRVERTIGKQVVEHRNVNIEGRLKNKPVYIPKSKYS